MFSVHNDLVLARDDTRMVARDWMERNIPVGTKIVMEPIAPDQWAADAGRPLFGEPPVGTGSGNRWNKYATSRSCFFNGKLVEVRPCPVVKLEDYERTIRPRLITSYDAGGYCWVDHGLDPVRPRLRRPGRCRTRSTTTRRCASAGARSSTSPRTATRTRPVLVRLLVQLLPAEYERPGPEIVIYRLDGGDCAHVVPRSGELQH